MNEIVIVVACSTCFCLGIKFGWEAMLHGLTLRSKQLLEEGHEDIAEALRLIVKHSKEENK